jgi:hypothetical protein
MLFFATATMAYAGMNTYVLLRPGGKATYVKPSIFSKEKFDLAYTGGKWRYRNNSSSGELKTPYECSYSENRNLHLEANGKVYLVSKKDKDRIELRVIGGEWLFNPSGEWIYFLEN